MNLRDKTVEELRAYKKKLEEDLAEVQNELKVARTLVNPKTRPEYERFHAPPASTSTGPTPKLSDQKMDLQLLRHLTGLTIVDVKDMVDSVEMKSSNEMYFTYTILGNIEKLRFAIEFTTNQPPDYSGAGEYVENVVIKTLNIRMGNKIQIVELEEFTKFYAANPELLGSALLNLNAYYDLYLARSLVLGYMKADFPDYITTNLDENTGHFELLYLSSDTKVKYLIIEWYIMWVEKTLSLRDYIKCEIFHDDSQMITELKPLLKHFCKAENLTTEQKQKICQNIMMSVKDADSRFYFQNKSD